MHWCQLWLVVLQPRTQGLLLGLPALMALLLLECMGPLLVLVLVLLALLVLLLLMQLCRCMAAWMCHGCCLQLVRPQSLQGWLHQGQVLIHMVLPESPLTTVQPVQCLLR